MQHTMFTTDAGEMLQLSGYQKPASLNSQIGAYWFQNQQVMAGLQNDTIPDFKGNGQKVLELKGWHE